MHRFSLLIVASVVFFTAGATPSQADWVVLANNDVVQGKILSLDGETLKLESENFGEMTIPRSKVTLIGLGERPVPTQHAAAPGLPAQPSAQVPSLENPQVNQLLQEALGGGGLGEMQQKIGKTQRDLKELQRDLGPGPSSDALDSYIRMFELFGNMVPSEDAPPQESEPNQN